MTHHLPARRPGIEARDIGGETLLHDQSGEDIHVLNPTAAFIWSLCDGQHTPADIAAALREEYAIPPANDPAADIARVLAIFRDRGLRAQPNEK